MHLLHTKVTRMADKSKNVVAHEEALRKASDEEKR